MEQVAFVLIGVIVGILADELVGKKVVTEVVAEIRKLRVDLVSDIVKGLNALSTKVVKIAK